MRARRGCGTPCRRGPPTRSRQRPRGCGHGRGRGRGRGYGHGGDGDDSPLRKPLIPFGAAERKSKTSLPDLTPRVWIIPIGGWMIMMMHLDWESL